MTLCVISESSALLDQQCRPLLLILAYNSSSMMSAYIHVDLHQIIFLFYMISIQYHNDRIRHLYHV